MNTLKASVGTPSFANLKGNPSLQALVPVYHTDGSRIVDLYVYDQITGAHPVRLFTLQGLSFCLFQQRTQSALVSRVGARFCAVLLQIVT